LTSQGLYLPASGKVEHYTHAITGGTGFFASARGVLEITQSADATKYDYVVKLQ